MKRTLLKFYTLQQVTGTHEASVIILTDELKQRALSVVCDQAVAQQFAIRANNEMSRLMLPEALLQLIGHHYEMLIVGLYDGQYQVLLMDLDSNHSVRIRLSDAVLLSVISDFPLYIEDRLMQQQSAPFDENTNQVAIPINTMDAESLQSALERAVEAENYELASHLRDEIKSRES